MNNFPPPIRLICLPYAGGSTACFEPLWTYAGSYAPLPLPATVFSATGEDNTEEEIHAWSREFAGAISFERFEGSRFFLFEQAEAFVERLLSRLSVYDRHGAAHSSEA